MKSLFVSPDATEHDVHTLKAIPQRDTVPCDAQVRTNEWDLDRDCDLLRAHITEQMAGVLEPGTWRLIETIQARASRRGHICPLPCLHAGFAALQEAYLACDVLSGNCISSTCRPARGGATAGRCSSCTSSCPAGGRRNPPHQRCKKLIAVSSFLYTPQQLRNCLLFAIVLGTALRISVVLAVFRCSDVGGSPALETMCRCSLHVKNWSE